MNNLYTTLTWRLHMLCVVHPVVNICNSPMVTYDKVLHCACRLSINQWTLQWMVLVSSFSTCAVYIFWITPLAKFFKDLSLPGRDWMTELLPYLPMEIVAGLIEFHVLLASGLFSSHSEPYILWAFRSMELKLKLLSRCNFTEYMKNFIGHLLSPTTYAVYPSSNSRRSIVYRSSNYWRSISRKCIDVVSFIGFKQPVMNRLDSFRK